MFMQDRFPNHELVVSVMTENQVSTHRGESPCLLSSSLSPRPSLQAPSPELRSMSLSPNERPLFPELGLIADEKNLPASNDCESQYPTVETAIIGGHDPMTDCESDDVEAIDPTSWLNSQASTASTLDLDMRINAFKTALIHATDGSGWEIGLLSRTDHHGVVEKSSPYHL